MLLVSEEDVEGSNVVLLSSESEGIFIITFIAS